VHRRAVAQHLLDRPGDERRLRDQPGPHLGLLGQDPGPVGSRGPGGPPVGEGQLDEDPAEALGDEVAAPVGGEGADQGLGVGTDHGFEGAHAGRSEVRGEHPAHEAMARRVGVGERPLPRSSAPKGRPAGSSGSMVIPWRLTNAVGRPRMSATSS